MSVVDIGKPYYRIKDRRIVYRAIVTNSEKKKYFLDLKKHKIHKDRMLNAVIRNIAFFVDGKFRIITTPPGSGIGVDWAECIAREIAKKTGMKYMQVFEKHREGKRYLLYQKFRETGGELRIGMKGKKVLIFDDFSLTRRTMVKAIKMLKKGNEVGGLVLCA